MQARREARIRLVSSRALRLVRSPARAESDAGTLGGTWLLAVDGSAGADYAAQYVAGIAKRLGVAEVRILNVQPEPGRGHGAQTMASPDEAAEQATANSRRMLRAAGLNVTLEVAIGPDPARLIANAARKSRVDEIVMGTRGMSALGNLALGSVAYKVLHLARVPVTLIPVGKDARASRQPARRKPLALLLASDGSAASHRAVRYVCRLAQACAIEVRLVNVQPRILSGNVRSYISRAQIEAYQQDEGMKSLRGAIRLLEQAAVAYSVHILAGPPAERIVRFAHEAGCDRIVMGTRGLAAASSWIMGSAAYGVVHRADLPVTLVK